MYDCGLSLWGMLAAARAHGGVAAAEPSRRGRPRAGRSGSSPSSMPAEGTTCPTSRRCSRRRTATVHTAKVPSLNGELLDRLGSPA